MTTWIALLRGINVGGRVLPMADLTTLLAKAGFRDIRTYIQSGNAVFRGSASTPARVAERIEKAILKSHGFQPRVLVVSVEGFEKAVRANPFPQATANHRSLHLYFLIEPPAKPDLAALKKLKSGNENFVLTNDVFYLHAPDGIGRSKLAAQVEKLLGVPTTARNWRTVSALREMARDLP